MNEDFSNVYDDQLRAEEYSRLKFPGTYYLAYRDLPAILANHAKGRVALDFGCGTGRSTRFLRDLGFETIGVDISKQMVMHAQQLDPKGKYLVVGKGNLEQLGTLKFDVVLSTFTFDNIPKLEMKLDCLRSINQLLNRSGCLVNLVSTPEIYTHEWASFSTKDYPENVHAKNGDTVRIVMLDVDDRRPVDDVLFTNQAYQEVYDGAGLTPIETYRPLGNASDPCDWVNENTIAPWCIYVLAPKPL